MGLWEISTDGGSTFTDLDDLYFFVTSATGVGMVPVTNLSSPLALQPGATYEKTKEIERPFALLGAFNTDGSATLANFHSRKATLLKALNANAGTKINERADPIVLKYTGATVDKVINCYYEGGLEDSSRESNAFSQDPVTLRFVAFDPFFYAASETSTALDPNDQATFTHVYGKIGGLWDNLGPPNAAGTYTTVLSVISDDTYVYFGGNFSNFDNIANADGIVRYNKSTGAYSAMGTGVGSGNVLDMALGPTGDLYVVGTFLNMGGVAAADYIAVWDGSSWAALGTPGSGATVTDVAGVAVSPDGNVYVAGNFTNLAGVAAADHAARWTGSTWVGMGTGLNGAADGIIVKSADEVIYMGDFSQAGGVSDTDSVAYWNNTDGVWVSMNTGTVTGIVLGGALDSGGNLYVTGSITSIGGASVTRLAKYNGASWSDVGGGLDNTGRRIQFAPDGTMYVAGDFANVGSGNGALSTSQGLAIWNGSTWNKPDITATNADFGGLWIEDNGDVYLGSNNDSSHSYAGNTTIAYAGTAVAYPYITFAMSGSGGVLDGVSNATTGATIYIDRYTVQDGETLTLDLRPFSDTPFSASSTFGGNVNNIIRGGSDLGNFFLSPGRESGSNNNVVTVLGAASMTVTIYYTVAYLSQD